VGHDAISISPSLRRVRDYAAGVSAVDEAIERLSSVLPRCRALEASLQGPVSDEDLDALRRAIAPLEIPDELVALLRWADGQPDRWNDRLTPAQAASRIPWWPSLNDGVLLSAQRIVRLYRQNRQFDAEGMPSPARLLPFCGEQLSQASIEIAEGRVGVVVSTPYDDGMHLAAPSLASVLEAAADLVEAGHPIGDDDWPGREWHAERLTILAARYERDGWGNWPYGQELGAYPSSWPEPWRS
jgi:hypothetical protein